MKIVERDIVGAILISQDGKLFQGRKDPTQGGVYSDCWHIPGGGIEEGEDEITALKREVLEETGIDIFSSKIILVDDIGIGESEKTDRETGENYLCKMKFSVYKIDLDQEAKDIEVSLDSDLVEYQWTDMKKISEMKLTPPSIELFKRLGYIE